jgi:hypothetical protein
MPLWWDLHPGVSSTNFPALTAGVGVTIDAEARAERGALVAELAVPESITGMGALTRIAVFPFLPTYAAESSGTRSCDGASFESIY